LIWIKVDYFCLLRNVISALGEEGHDGEINIRKRVRPKKLLAEERSQDAEFKRTIRNRSRKCKAASVGGFVLFANVA